METDRENQPFINKYSDDPSVTEPQPPNFRPARRRAQLLSHILVFLATSLLWILVIVFVIPNRPDSATWRTPHSVVSSSSSSHHDHDHNDDSVSHHQTLHSGRHNITSNARLITCGNSTAEARSLGCKYDILLNNWVPAQCADPDSVEEYMDDMSWTGYSDKNLTQKLTVEEMSERDFYYTSVRDHINHCAIMWRRQFWALFEDRGSFDSVVASPGHTEHCSQFLMDVGENQWTEPTRTEMGFAGCWVREDRT